MKGKTNRKKVKDQITIARRRGGRSLGLSDRKGKHHGKNQGSRQEERNPGDRCHRAKMDRERTVDRNETKPLDLSRASPPPLYSSR